MGRRQRSGCWALDALVKGLQTEDTVDVSRVIAEEDPTEGREGADEVRLPGHGSLDAIDIAGGSDGSSAARHGYECAIGSVELRMG